MKRFIILLFAITATTTFAQDFVDIFGAGYTLQPAVSNPDGTKTVIEDYSTELTIPVPVNDNNIILSGIDYTDYQLNNIGDDNQDIHIRGFQLHLGLLKKWNDKWSTTAIAINRLNTNRQLGYGKRNVAQFGGLVLMNDKVNETKTWKFGAYLNRDLYSLMLVPIIGYDIKFNEKWSLTGVFPINTTIRNKVSEKLHLGLYFRGMITSFAYNTYEGNDYIERSNDEISLFSDFYISKNIVLNLRGGIATGRHYQRYAEGDEMDFRISIFKFGEDRTLLNEKMGGTSLNFHVGLKFRINTGDH